MPVLLNDILSNTNTLFDKGFIHNYTGELNDIEIIEEPVIMMHTLHGCYSHAIIDSCFPVYFMLQQLLENNYITNTNVRIFILKDYFNYFPNNHNWIDSNTHLYLGSWQNIIEILTEKPIIFEHLTKKKYLFKHSFQYPENDRWQRSIWNCVDYYPHRNISKQDVLYTDDYISKMLHSFRLHVFNKYNIANDVDNAKELIIIERKHNKKIGSSILDNILQEAQQNIHWIYSGLVILEDMHFSEQIKLFNKTRIFIFRHGSCLINLLWCKPGTIVFELEGGREGTGFPVVTKRLCDLLSLHFIPLNYDTFNPKCDIFNKINMYL